MVEGNWAYCPVCARPRILEGLQAPVAEPVWQQQVWQGLIAVVSLWLLVTLGVAFLREAKAVRVSRQLLAEGKVQEAWALLQPFLPDHPNHRQGLFLCGKATIRLGLKEEPKRCLEQLDQLSPDLAKDLRADYGPVLTEQARRLNCENGKFEELLAWGDQLGENFTGNVIAGLDGVVDSCRAAQNDPELARIAKALKDKGKAMAMVEHGFLPAIGRAVAQARYQDAEVLARLAVRQVPEGEASVAAALKNERQKVTATVETLHRLRESLKSDASYRSGYYWCFPSTGPTVVQSARDGWGNVVQYRPAGGSYAIAGRDCHQGFAVVSTRSPATEFNCSFQQGWENCVLPSRFWWTGK
jgi:tetratricopeptide (TPR) repeat protein